MLGPLLQTKFYIPPIRPNLVPRPQLLAKLNDGLADGRLFSRRLTLVSAPAGFGKTTLITHWLHDIQSANADTAVSSGWLSLDENDNDLHRFLAYLVAAVQKAESARNGQFGEELLAALQSPRPPVEDDVLPILLNELAALKHPLLLVLDDYHLITQPAIHNWLAQLIDHLPPQTQLVMTSREDPSLPLPRWRVRGQLTEIRAADLRFSVNETADFLHHTMGLSLADDVVSKLESRTEGWIAGLQLAAIAIQSPPTPGAVDVGQLVADFSGSDRHVANYLLEEVLQRQPAARQQFLLETAVLERFNAAVCNHLTSRQDSQEALNALHQNNLFVIPLDNRGEWYRYHHLFAQLLRHRLAGDETADQRAARHRKARDWFEQQALMDEAIYHALKAGDASWVAEYLCRFSPDRLWEGTMASSFKNWINQLPSNLVEQRPCLLMLMTWACLITADIKGAEASLWRMVEIPDPDETIQAGILLVQAVLARGQGDSETALTLVSKALKTLPESQESMRMIAYMQIASASLSLGLLDQAHNVCRFVYDSVDKETTAGLNLYVNVVQMLSITMRSRLQYYQAVNTLLHTLEVVKKQATVFLPMIGVVYAELGQIYYEWNELDKAAEYCRQTMELGERSGITDLFFPSYLLDADLARHEGDLKRLAERLRWLKEITRRSDLAEMVGVADYLEAAFRLNVGDVAAAVRWANASGLRLDDQPTYQRYGHYHTLARIFMAESLRAKDQNQQIILAQVDALLGRLMTLVQEASDSHSQVELFILKAILLNMQGHEEEALAVLAEAVALAEQGTLIRKFLDSGPAVYPLIQRLVVSETAVPTDRSIYLQQLLKACQAEWGGIPTGQLVNTIARPLADPLTEREREVLACLAAGLTNREIEERLVISRNTVRTHLKNLYSKLGATGRKEALEQAQLLGLL